MYERGRLLFKESPKFHANKYKKYDMIVIAFSTLMLFFSLISLIFAPEVTVILFSIGIGFLLVGILSLLKTPYKIEVKIFEYGILVPSTPTQRLPGNEVFIPFDSIQNIYLDDNNIVIIRTVNNFEYKLPSDYPEELIKRIEDAMSYFT